MTVEHNNGDVFIAITYMTAAILLRCVPRDGENGSSENNKMKNRKSRKEERRDKEEEDEEYS